MLSYHHTGLLVKSIEDAILHYGSIFGQESISRIFNVESQGVKVCFVTNGSASRLELVEPTSDESKVYGMLKKRISYYHVAYEVSDIDSSIEKLEALNYKCLEKFRSEAFEGRHCCFLFTPEAHLIELIEK